MRESPMVLPLGRAERRAAGRKRRSDVPRRSRAELSNASLGIIDGRNSTRVLELVPLRTERMSQSPFAFYRGTAAKASPLRRYYAHFEAAAGTGRMHPESRKVLDRAIGQAKKRMGERASRKLTQQDDGAGCASCRPPRQWCCLHSYCMRCRWS